MTPILELLKKYLGHDVEAHSFVVCYILYCHAIDDIVDGDKTDSEHIIKTFEFALTLYSSPFYLKYWHILYPLIKMSGNTYADSVKFERNPQPWNRAYADVLRHMANEVIVAAIEIVSGFDKRREASEELRRISYKDHHTLEGIPV